MPELVLPTTGPSHRASVPIEAVPGIARGCGGTTAACAGAGASRSSARMCALGRTEERRLSLLTSGRSAFASSTIANSIAWVRRPSSASTRLISCRWHSSSPGDLRSARSCCGWSDFTQPPTRGSQKARVPVARRRRLASTAHGVAVRDVIDKSAMSKIRAAAIARYSQRNRAISRQSPLQLPR